MGLLTLALVGTAGVVEAVVAAPVLLAAVGFTSAGIAAGADAPIMLAGGAVAACQTAGVVGLPAAASAGVAGVGATIGWITAILI